ncbi:MAG TPA: hypothetical protein ENH82_11155 [bacterium]|nr:hypothetical protein [bacterium]
MARPKRQFTDEDEQQMYDYALSGCQNGTIAKLMCIAETTLTRRFGAVLKEKRAERKYNLRKNQTDQSVHNPAMAIFLGKNELGQVDKQVITTTPEITTVPEAEKAAMDAACKVYKLKLAGSA